MIDHSVIKKIDEKLKDIFDNSRHLIEASDRIIMANVRNNVDPIHLLDEIQNVKAFDYEKFNKSNQGNIYDFVPFKKSNRKNHSYDEILKLNALYWKIISDEDVLSMTDDELKLSMMCRAFDNVFAVSDQILIIDDNGNFVRFKSSNAACSYYKKKMNRLSFEIRSNQKNPCAMYLHTLR